MKKHLLLFVMLLVGLSASAQYNRYTTFVYTSPTLANEITASYVKFSYNHGDSRSLLGELGTATLNAAKGIASGYVASVFDLGVQAVANLVTRNQRKHAEWQEIVDSENVFTTYISSVSDLSDFYSSVSTDGALDSKGMAFDGVGCLRMEGDDTVFYISCHIDRSKIDRIIRHGKFQLVLDTLIISPLHSNLPNSSFDTAFSFADRDNYMLVMHMEITSSWMDNLPQMHKDQELGQFTLTIPVPQSSLDSTGFLRYVRKQDEAPRYRITGESFIVPRSYTGIVDNTTGKMIFGTGQYNMSISLRESCSLTQSYRDNWKKNYKQRKKAIEDGEGILSNVWQTITQQQWDELSQQWIITVLQAPTDIIKQNAINELKLGAE